MGYRKLLIMVALLLLGQPLFAQGGLQVSGGVIGNPQAIYVADLLTLSGKLPSSRGVGKDIFFVELINSTGRNANLHVRFLKDGQEISEGAWQSRSPVSRVRLTNTNLLQSGYNKIVKRFEFTEDDLKRISGNISTSGDLSAPTLVPSGLYVLECWLGAVFQDGTEDPSNQSNHIFITFNVINPTGFVSLIAPGHEVGTVIDEVYTLTPVFAWQGDAQRYRIRVWEKLPGQRTFDEVRGNNPHADEEVFAPTFQYPVGAVRVLEPGKIYFWQVESVSDVAGRGSPSGTGSMPFVFKMADNLNDGTPYNVQLRRAKDILLSLGINAKWLEDADFVSFSVEGDGQGTTNSTDINSLVEELKNLESGQ